MLLKVRGISILRHYDYLLLAMVLALTVLGFFVLRSATATMIVGESILRRQFFSMILGFGICLFLSLLDYTNFRIWGYISYGILILLLIYVIPFGFGRDVPGIGTNSWIAIGGFTFQPSEIGKIAYMIAIPALFTRLKEEFRFTRLLVILIVAILPIALTLFQPEFGMAVVLSVGLLSIIFVYGLKYRYLLAGLAALAVAAPFVWQFGLEDFQQDRIRVFLNPGYDLSGAGYQTNRARIAIGSGQLTGSGLFRGIHSQSAAGIPVKESDFIFTVIGEELGFLGAVAVILLFAAILVRCFYIASTSKDLFGSYMVTGLSAMMTFHFIVNVGMNIGLLPVTGIPLPFISAGGTAMITNFAAIGLIISVSTRRRT